MTAVSLVLATVAVFLSLLAVFLHQWITVVPQLGIGMLYHRRRIRIGLAAGSLGLAGVGYAVSPTRVQLGLLGLVVLLTPLSGFLHAGRLFVPLDSPDHVTADDGDVDGETRVVGTAVGGQAHAWTVDTLVPHHLVNDQVDGRPVLAAWCAYCNSGIVFDPVVDGQRLTFEPLAVYRRNMVMRDRETGTLWQHATGEALAGPLAGTRLDGLGGQLTTWRAWHDEQPETTLAVEPDEGEWAGLLPRDRTRRLAAGTERVELPGATATDTRLPFTEVVVGVEIGGEATAYPLATLRERGSLGDTIGGVPVALTYEAESDRVDVTSGGEPVAFQRTRWMGWFEFHPETEVYEAPTG